VAFKFEDVRTWPAFERLVAALQRRLDPAAVVTWDERVEGRSGRKRQLDVVVRGRVGIAPIMLVVECKEYSKPVGIELVEAFFGKLADVGADRGVMVARTGFTKDALSRAEEARIITSVVRPALDTDWEGYLRSLELRIVSRAIVHHDLELQLVDGRKLRVSSMEQVADVAGKSTFLDRVINQWLANNEWQSGAPIVLALSPPLRLLRDDEEPAVAAIHVRPESVDGFESVARIVSPEDWVLFGVRPSGTSDEKTFFELADLAREADTFKAPPGP
jgi:hypothetical protein